MRKYEENKFSAKTVHLVINQFERCNYYGIINMSLKLLFYSNYILITPKDLLSFNI